MVARSSTRVEVHASLSKRADCKHGACLIVVLSLGDDIPALAICSTACADLNRGQVGTEVPGQFVDEQTLAVGCLNVD